MTALVAPAARAPSGGRVPPARVESRAARWGRGAGTAVVATLLLVPFLPVLLWAFADRWPYPELAPTVWGMGGWLTATAQGAGPALGRSLLLGLTVSAIATPLGAMAGRALARGQVPCGRLVTAILLVPVAVPPFAVTMGLTTVALRLGVPGAVALVAVLVVAAVPYTTYIMRAAYAGYDEGFEETARTLGAGRRHVLLRVHLPLVAPALAAAAFLAFLVGWSDYVVTLLIGAGRIVSLPLILGASASGNDPTIAVLALLAAIPPVLLLATVTVLSRRRTQR
ncbi:ABC transporter permease [Promicromonospora aerolata]|uniref:ABC transporter permease n=1 Tax=Promicromonospora aerolata TaxID=195749 RepID=A0ABW4V205_9MICO